MVRPRKAQIKNLQTRHSLLEYLAPVNWHPDLPTGITSTVISESEMNAAVISDIPEGAQEDLPARILSTSTEPYAVVAGYAINLRLDGDIGVTTITFDNTDTTASRIANKINTTYGSTLAINLEGKLAIKSLTPGSDGSIEISDSVSGTLAALGMAAGTYFGLDAGTRGVVTRSLDDKGGWVPLKTQGGKDVLTDCPSVLYYFREFSGIGLYLPEYPAGLPIHGRLTWDGSQYTIKYYAPISSYAEVITFNSNFSTLTSGDSFTVSYNRLSQAGGVSGGGFAVIFTGSHTRDEVLDLINAAYATSASGGSPPAGPATIRGNISQPYSFATGEQLWIDVDSGGGQSVTFATSDVTAQDVVNKINTSVTGVTASVITDGYKKFVQIVNDNTDGYTSSLEIRNDPSTGGLMIPDTAGKLGISEGMYRGSFIAEPYGNAEIRIRGLIRGDRDALTIGGNASTLQKLGLIAGVYQGLEDAETPVEFPQLTSTVSITNARVRALIPEVLEFGEVDPAVHSVNEQFDSRVAGTPDIHARYADAWPNQDPVNKCIRGAGSPVVTDPMGVIHRKFLRPALEEFYNLFGQIARGNFDPRTPDVDALVASIIETPGTKGNTLPLTYFFNIEVDPSGYYSTSYVEFNVEFYRDHTSAIIPFRVKREFSYSSEFTWVVNIGAAGQNVVLNNLNGSLLLGDVQIAAAGNAVGGIHYLPLTAYPDARYPRLIEREANDVSGISLLKKVNAQWTCTVGDGTDTFGDFNGSTAIQDAIDYCIANTSFNTLVIQVKNGTYGPIDTSAAPSSFILTIKGTGGACTIRDNNETVKIGIDSSTTINHVVILKDMQLSTISSGSLPLVSVNNGCSLQCYNSSIFGAITFKNAYTATFKNCILSAVTTGGKPVQFIYDGNTIFIREFDFENCAFRPGDGGSAIFVKSNSATTPTSVIPKIECRSCEFYLRETTVTSGTISANGGIFEVNSNNANGIGIAGTGVRVREINFLDCNVTFSSTSGSYAVIYHTPKGLAATGYLPVDEMNIRGGTWHLPDRNTNINPVTIYGIGDGINVGGSNEQLPGLNLSDVSIQYPATTSRTRGGQPILQHEAWFGDDLVANYLRWGLVAIGADTGFKVDGLRILNILSNQEIGDLFFKWGDNLINSSVLINNIDLHYHAAGSGTVPSNRIRFRPPLMSSGHSSVAKISKINVHGSIAAQGSNIIVLDANSILSSVSISDCSINNTNGGVGIRLQESATPIYTGGGTDFYDITISNNRILQLASNSAIYIDLDEAQAARNIKITNNTIAYFGNHGIYFSGWDYLGLLIHDNIIYNGLGNGEGIHVIDRKDEEESSPVMIIDNHVYNTGTDITETQIRFQIIKPTAGSKSPVGVIKGNNCVDGTYGFPPGKIWTNCNLGLPPGGPAALYSPVAVGTYAAGLETGIDNNTSNNPLYLRYDDDSAMLQNQAILKSSG